jgi:putative membrane protein
MRRTIIALALLLPLAACSRNTDSGRQYSSTPAPAQPALSGTTAMTPAAIAQLTAADHAFLIDAAQGNLAEVELGRLAEQRGASAQVRDFGRMMAQQHGQSNQDLTAIAQRLGVPMPAALAQSDQAAQLALQAASGQEFDRQYLEHQAAAHLERRSLLQFTSNYARNPELRAFAQKSMTGVERHLEQLRTIAPVVTRSTS